ncbi:hypothetical protein WH47_08661, partial [Habropoda laboriosa]
IFLELHGTISITYGNPSNLIFLVRGQRYRGNDTSSDQGQISPDGGGVMSMQGNSGLPLWLVSLKRQPTEIDCISVDTDRSGKPDCIVAGDQGLLASIEPIAGTIHWSSKIYTFKKLPLILSDIDSDGVEDFLSIEIAVKNMPNIVLLSGGSGSCPGEFCRASVNLTLQKHGNQPVIIWDHISPNSFVSKPAFLIMPGKPYTSGFAIKFWQWINPMSEHTKKVSIITERRLIERVLIVFVNYTDVQVMNASQSDIIQLCQDGNCQPNLNSRARFSSIKIDYISKDNFPELISYWSSYDMESPKILTSKVQVAKLDSLVMGLPHINV